MGSSSVDAPMIEMNVYPERGNALVLWYSFHSSRMFSKTVKYPWTRQASLHGEKHASGFDLPVFPSALRRHP